MLLVHQRGHVIRGCHAADAAHASPASAASGGITIYKLFFSAQPARYHIECLINGVCAS